MQSLDIYQKPSATSIESQRKHEELVGSSAWSRLIRNLIKAERMPAEYAARTMDQTVGFLRVCAAFPEDVFAPSKPVDKGWHNYILHTPDYMRICDQLAGQYIHHMPRDEEEITVINTSPLTVAAMRRLDIWVDEPLWVGEQSHCDDDDCRNGLAVVPSMGVISAVVELPRE